MTGLILGKAERSHQTGARALCVLQTEALPQLIRKLKQSLCKLKPGYPQALPGILKIKKISSGKRGIFKDKCLQELQIQLGLCSKSMLRLAWTPCQQHQLSRAAGNQHWQQNHIWDPPWHHPDAVHTLTGRQDTEHNTLNLTFEHTPLSRLCISYYNTPPN